MSMPHEPGGLAPEGLIPLCVPELIGDEWRYVKECLDTGWVSSVGSYVNRFEREIAAAVGKKHGVATINGTAALHVALLVSGVEAEDEVVVSALTFIAPANAIRYAGAWPVFIDAEPDYWQMDPARVVRFLEQGCQWNNGVLRNARTGRRVRAIMPVDILGHPVDMDPILDIAQKFGLTVVEDATESLGALYKTRPVGQLGDLACFSFNGNKLITTGGGGMIVTDDEMLARRARYLTTQAKDDPIEFIHGTIGYNYRLSNVQAAMGCAQLEHLDSYVTAKRQIAERYAEAISAIPGLTPMPQAPWARSTYWLYTTLVDAEQYGTGSRSLFRVLASCGIQARPLWQPLHRSPAHRNDTHSACPVADRLNRDALSLPCSVGLSHAAQLRVIDVLREKLKGNCGSAA
jgi:perosamine synthetase